MFLRRKLWICCLATGLITAGVGGGLLGAFNEARTSLDVARDDSLLEIQQSGRIAGLANHLATALGGMVTSAATGSEERTVFISQAIGQLRSAITATAVALAHEQAMSEQNDRTSDVISAHVKELSRSIGEMESKWNHLPSEAKARQAAVEEIDTASDALVEQSLQLQRLCTADMFGHLANSSSVLREVTVSATAVVAGLVPIGLLLAFGGVKRLGKRLDHIREAAARIGMGELSTQINDNVSDEIGVLARTVNDMSGQLQNSLARLEHDAVHDALTGLPNRVLFLDRAEQRLAMAGRDGRYDFAVMFVDLDRFKLINDSLGHAAGDELLRTIASRLEKLTSEEQHVGQLRMAIQKPYSISTVARLGGDEFTVLIDELPEDPGEAMQVVDAVASEVRTVLSSRFIWGRRK